MKYVTLSIVLFLCLIGYGQTPSEIKAMLNNYSFQSPSADSIMIGVPGGKAKAPLDISNTANGSVPLLGTLMKGSYIGSVGASLLWETFNNTTINGSSIRLNRARGTDLSPTAVIKDDLLGLVSGRGWGTTGYSTAANAAIDFHADGTFTDASMPTYITLRTTPVGASTFIERFRILSDGRLKSAAWAQTGIVRGSATDSILTVSALTGSEVNTALGYTAANAASVPAAQIQSDFNQASTGALDFIKNKPTNLSAFTNGPGYITGITSGNVTTALGYTPINPNGTTAQYFRGDGSKATFPTAVSSFTNDAGYLTSYTETDPQFATKFAAQSTTGLAEGTNLYYTAARFNTAFAGKNTDGLSEGSTNLYYTAARFNTAFAAKTTDGLAEGTTNLYFTNARSRNAITFTTTGTSGAASYNTSTGAMNVPNYTPAAKSFNNTASHSIVTTINAANGFQVSSTRDAQCSYSITISANATGLLAGASSGYVVYEVCATNSATGTDWQEIGRWTNGQTFTSVLTLTSNQPVGSDISKTVQSGWFVRLRSVNVSGTPTFTYNSGQEVLQ